MILKSPPVAYYTYKYNTYNTTNENIGEMETNSDNHYILPSVSRRVYHSIH